MATTNKPTSATKTSVTKAAAPTKAGTKKTASTTAIAKKTAPATPATRPSAPKKAPPAKKAALEKTAASMSVSRTTNPRTNTITIKKITRNIVGFHMTEDIEIRRVTRSDNVSSEKLKAKYADLKAKVTKR